jgi:hypothetical protein
MGGTLESLVKLALLLLVLPFILAYHLFRWTFMAFRSLWKSDLDLRVKWGVTGGVALLVLIVVISSPHQSSTQLASTQAQAATTTATPMPEATATTPQIPAPTPTPSSTPAPVAQPVAVPVAPKATAPPPPPPAPPFNYCGAPANPWHYNFCGGSVIYSPPSSFCSYFNCIASFRTEDIPNDGYVEQCVDSRFSLSGGESGGVCSSHGGPSRPLYAP